MLRAVQNKILQLRRAQAWNFLCMPKELMYSYRMYIVASRKLTGFKEVVVFLRCLQVLGLSTMVFPRFVYVNI